MTVDDQKPLLDSPVGVDDEESMTKSKHLRIGKLALASLLLGELFCFDGTIKTFITDIQEHSLFSSQCR